MPSGFRYSMTKAVKPNHGLTAHHLNIMKAFLQKLFHTAKKDED